MNVEPSENHISVCPPGLCYIVGCSALVAYILTLIIVLLCVNSCISTLEHNIWELILELRLPAEVAKM